MKRDSAGMLLKAFRASGCSECGVRYPDVPWEDLHIDHIDPATKLFHLAAKRWTQEEGLAELLKCRVLCKACHKARHREEAQVTPGQLPLFRGTGGWHYEVAS